jgi:predicted dehydrogenase
MTESIKVGVVGVGHHGRHHARNFAALDGVQLVGVVDPNKITAERVAESCDTQAYCHPSDLLDQVDAVSIAAPTHLHFTLAKPFLERGIATLVEKPLSFSTEQGREMVRLARTHRAPLMVGHIERFNPAWSAAKSLDSPPESIEATRFSRYPFRSLDVSVVFDVMIHDIDLAMSVGGWPVRSLRAAGGAVLSPSPDWADVQLETESGAIIHLRASRVHHATQRQMSMRTKSTLVEIDFQRRSSNCHRLNPSSAGFDAASSPLSPEQKEYLLSNLFSTSTLNHAADVESLRIELEEFMAAARERRDPLVTGEDGLRAVILATQIETCLTERTTRPLRLSA